MKLKNITALLTSTQVLKKKSTQNKVTLLDELTLIRL